MDDYQRKFYAQEKIRPFDEKKARWWYPYRGSEELKVKEEERQVIKMQMKLLMKF